ncbi:hypothetical protein Bca52824_011479 [Brassica carinata]|uniref:Uncharacterized protein n=1 Tax=Brassica carinata TaxID=52824 RepID=A0A8X7WFX6_BRACI|nr:hypothetical protein Bca52824_011479 [Brassica carinata]
MRDGDYSIGSWASNYQYESFEVETATPTYITQPEEVSSIDTAPTQSTDRPEQPSTDSVPVPSTDTCIKPSQVTNSNVLDFGNLIPDEFGIFRDSQGFARSMDGRTLNISREDIADVLQSDRNGRVRVYQTNTGRSTTRSSRRFRWNHSESTWCLVVVQVQPEPVENAVVETVQWMNS